VLSKKDMRSLAPRVNALELFRRIPRVKHRIAPLKEAQRERKVIALRVDFAEDDDSRTTGNGRMDYEGNGEEPISEIIGGDTLLNPYYDGPHTKGYFEMLLQCLRNFYLVNSYGNLRIDYRVFPEGDSAAYQLPHTMLYYGNPDDMELGLCTLMRDAIIAAEEQDTTFDFRWWFNTSDDLLIFHAGSAWQTDIMWDSPYDIAAAYIPRGALLYYLLDDLFLPPRFGGGTILPEMARQDGVMFGLEGEVLHEYAHNLGHFDFYDVTGWSMGVGACDLMGYGGWLGDPLLPPGRVPSMHSAFFKCHKRWVEPVVVEGDTTITIDAAEMDTSELGEVGEKTLVVKVPINANEYYLIENRQEFAYSETLYADMEMGVIVYVEGGQWDYFLPGSGLHIWHIDQQVIDENWATNTVNADASRKGVDLEEADGVQDFDGWVEGSSYEIYGSSYDPFFSPHNDSFAPRTNPNTADNDGGVTGIHVIQIGENGNSMSLRIIRGGNEKIRPRKGYPISLEDSSGFGTNSVNIWEVGAEKRIVIAGKGGDLHVVGDTALMTFSVADSIDSSPVVSDSILMAVSVNGRFYSWRPDGSPHWPPFTIDDGPFYASPAVGDVDGDDTAEVIVGSDNMRLYFIDNGSVVDTIFLGDVVRTSASVTDLDGDEVDEVVVSSGDSRLFVFTGDGDTLAGFPVITEILGPLEASPVVGDVDSDGELELVAVSMDHHIYCFDVSGGSEQYWPSSIGQPRSPSPVLGDIDRDGYLEVVVLSGGNLYALNHNGTICTGFPVEIREIPLYHSPWVSDVIGEDVSREIIPPCSSPILIDLEGDGYLEILFGSGTNVYGYDFCGEKLDGFPLGCGGAVSSTPAVVTKGDTLSLFVASDEGMLYCWEMIGDHGVAWPMFRGDPSHSGSYLDSPSVSPPSPPVLLTHVYNYPNPVYGSRTSLRYFLAGNATVRVKVFDVLGEIVAEYEGHTTPNEYNEVVLDLSGLASGVYVYKVEAKNSAQSEAVMGKLAIVR